MEENCNTHSEAPHFESDLKFSMDEFPDLTINASFLNEIPSFSCYFNLEGVPSLHGDENHGIVFPTEEQPSETSDHSSISDEESVRITRTDAQDLNPRSSNVLPFTTSDISEEYLIDPEVIGKGQFGIVRVCIHRCNGTIHACKSVSKSTLQTEEQRENLRTELGVMALLSDHPNVVKAVGVYEDVMSVHCVMDFCQAGDLFDLINSAKMFKEIDAAPLFCKIVSAVGYCHFRGLLHRDLKPENILLSVLPDGSYSPKLADFGLSTPIPNGQLVSGLAGSPFYMAPEVICGDSYGSPADMWSLGVILYIMLSGFLPFWGSNTPETFSRVCQCELDLESYPWPFISLSAKDLVRRLLSKVPYMRPTAKEVLMDPWIMSLGFPSSLFPGVDRNYPPFLPLNMSHTTSRDCEFSCPVFSPPADLSPLFPTELSNLTEISSPFITDLPTDSDPFSSPIMEDLPLPNLPPLIIPKQKNLRLADLQLDSSEFVDSISPASDLTTVTPFSSKSAAGVGSSDSPVSSASVQNGHCVCKPNHCLSKESCKMARQRLILRRRAAKEAAMAATLPANHRPPNPLARKSSSNKRKLTEIMAKCPAITNTNSNGAYAFQSW